MPWRTFNVGTLRVPGLSFASTARDATGAPAMICRSLLVDLDDGYALVDTGFSPEDVTSRGRTLGRAFMTLVNPVLDPAELLTAQLEQLGVRPEEVRHVLMTHLDVDHAGGLVCLPEATVHVHAAELEAATSRARAADRLRYYEHHFAHGPRWQAFSDAPDRWQGLPCGPLTGLPDGIRFVELPGHSPGHCGFLFDGEGGRLGLHAGDAFLEVAELVGPSRRTSLAARLHHAAADHDSKLGRTTRARLADAIASHGPGLTVWNAHDPAHVVDGAVTFG